MKYLPLKQTRVDALIKQCRHLNVFPLFLGFYYPKAEPGPHPVSDLLTELVEEAAGYLSIMTQEEVDSLVDSLPMYFQVYARREVVETSRKVALERTALGYLEALLQEQYFMIKDVVSDRVDESEVLKIYPELSTKFDNDGLLSLDNSFRLSDNGIAYKDHILHYHQFLRRGYGSNPNFDFLGKFIRFYYETKSRNRFRIAIDHRRIMPKEFFRQVGEKDSWFGPRFDKARLDDPTAVGLTVVLSNIPEGYRLFFPELDRTEF